MGQCLRLDANHYSSFNPQDRLFFSLMMFEQILTNLACSLELTLLTQKTEDPRIGWRGTNGFSGKYAFYLYLSEGMRL